MRKTDESCRVDLYRRHWPRSWTNERLCCLKVCRTISIGSWHENQLSLSALISSDAIAVLAIANIYLFASISGVRE